MNLRGDLSYLRVALESDVVNREFVGELEKLGVRYVRSDYFLSYKYVFLSHGRMVWTSELGPAQTEWYSPFRNQVAEAEQVALVPRSFRFARRLRRRRSPVALAAPESLTEKLRELGRRRAVLHLLAQRLHDDRFDFERHLAVPWGDLR